jgi:phosphoglycolate phosphatase/pyrophosphatase PpaX
MKYRCLVFDHDDTVVNSTATIHHPCFREFLKEYYPGRDISLEEYFIQNFTPGFVEMCRRDYGMDDAMLEKEKEYWLEYVQNHVPSAYPGIGTVMRRQKELGGLLCVVSHSMRHNILRDFRANGLPEPDLVYGWELPPEHRKPDPWALIQIRDIFGLRPEEILVIDDLKPGFDMAASCGADFAGAGWAYDIPFIEEFMRSNCRLYFKTVEELAAFLE